MAYGRPKAKLSNILKNCKKVETVLSLSTLYKKLDWLRIEKQNNGIEFREL